VVSEVNQSHAIEFKRLDPVSFYRRRQILSTSLLIFVVVVGLPIVGVPSLRHRLSTRVMALKTAMSGDIKPVTLEAGENHEPLPAEFNAAPPVPHPPELPQPERLFTMQPKAPAETGAAKAPRVLRMERILPSSGKTMEPPVQQAETAAATPPEGELLLKYQKGKAEQDAYDLLVNSNPTVAGMVKGSNPSLNFKEWDAANRGEDTYWVRLKFQSEGNEAEYIWQVKLESRQVSPLNFNARGIQ
jgi:hypothetical protein